MRRAALPLVGLLLAAGAAFWLLSGDPPQPPTTPGPANDVDVPARDPSLLKGAEVPAGAGEGGDRGRPTPRVAEKLRGRVEREDGSPVRGAKVQAALVHPGRLRGAPFADAPPLGAATTDADGTFELDAPAGRYLTVTAAAAGLATHAVRVADRAVFARIVLPQAAVLTVQITDRAGAPLQGARVEVTAVGTLHAQETNAKGETTFEALAPGDATLRASADGYATVAGPPRVVTPDPETVMLALPPIVQVQGIVVDAEGDAPLQGATVLVSQPGTSVDAGTTGADGRFGPVPAGGPGERQFVAVEAEGYAPALEPVVLRPVARDAPHTVRVRMHRAPPWPGRVLGAQGKPVQGAQVAYTDDGVAGRPPVMTTSDEGGWFTLPPPRPPVPGRRMVLFAEGPGGRAAWVVRTGAHAPSPLVLQLVPDASVFGRVLDRDGAPRGGAQMRLLPRHDRSRRAGLPTPAQARLALANEEGYADWTTATGEQGHWRIDGVPPGLYRLQMRASTHVVWFPDIIQVEDGDVNVGTFSLAGGAALTGVVSDRSGMSVPGARVLITAQADDFRPAWVLTDAQGRYAFEDLPRGTYGVSVRRGHATNAQAGTITIEDADEQLDVTLTPASTLDLHVLDAGGRWWNGVMQVHLRTPGRSGGSAPFTVRVQNGNAMLSGVRPGNYDVDAFSVAGYARADDTVTLEAGTPRIPVVLRWKPVASLSGRVETAAGQPSVGARVDLVDPASRRRLLATTDERGRFRFDDLRPAHYDVAAYGPGGAPTRDEVTVAEGQDATLTILLKRAGEVEVRVVGANGRAVRNARVVFRGLTGVVRGVRPGMTDGRGRVRREGLPLGPLTVQARDAAGHLGAATVEVRSGAPATVVVTLRPPPEPDARK